MESILWSHIHESFKMMISNDQKDLMKKKDVRILT